MLEDEIGIMTGLDGKIFQFIGDGWRLFHPVRQDLSLIHILLRKQCRAACDDFAERTFRTFTSWISAGEHLVEQDAQCIDIGAGVRLAEAVLLRSSIFSRTQENRILWFPGIKFTGCIEIDENYVVGGSQKDIGRFDICLLYTSK